MFTGGSLLLGGAGRTDLHRHGPGRGARAAQYRSMRRLGACLPADTAVCPTHGFGSYCAAGKPAGGGATIADQVRTNPAFHLDEDAFVDRLLGRLRPYPRYFAFMARETPGSQPRPTSSRYRRCRWTTSRAPTTDGPATPARPSSSTSVRERPTRPRTSPAASTSTAAGSLATWYGWLDADQAEVVLIASSTEDAVVAQRELRRIGVDAIVGACIAPDLTRRSPVLRGAGGLDPPPRDVR